MQPPASSHPPHPGSFGAGSAVQVMAPPVVLEGSSSHAGNYSFSGNVQPKQPDQSYRTNVEMGAMTSAPAFMQHVSQPARPNPSPNMPMWMPAAPSFQVPTGVPKTPITPGPPGIASSLPSPSTSTIQASPVDIPAHLRSFMPTAPVLSNSPLQYNAVAMYPSPSPQAAPPGPWLQPQQFSGFVRPSFSPYAAVVPGPYPIPSRCMSPVSVSYPDIQPPGVSPASFAADGQLFAGSGQAELPPGIDNSEHVGNAETKDIASAKEQLDAWTAHRTETGTVYYYNALTGESTYEKPSDFKGESDKAAVQPTPISCFLNVQLTGGTSYLFLSLETNLSHLAAKGSCCLFCHVPVSLIKEKLTATDWTLVTTNDGKNYYYNTTTQLSSWQIPSEVTELRKKQDADALKAQSVPVPNTNTYTEKGSDPVSLSTPAANTGGRDATAVRPSTASGSFSALDLIKMKLQDSGIPDSTSQGSALSGTVASELNGSKPIEAPIKDVQMETNKDKRKDTNGDGDMSNSSSDSEDEDGGPTKEECILQFKDMLKERGVAPFSKWEKELPKIVFDPRFKAIPNHSARRALFEHYVRTRAEEERKEKRAAQKAALEGFKQLLDEAKEEIDHNTDYQTFKRRWGEDPRFQALDRKDRELLLNERVLPLKRSVQERAQAERAAAISNFKSMLQDKGDITSSSRWCSLSIAIQTYHIEDVIWKISLFLFGLVVCLYKRSLVLFGTLTYAVAYLASMMQGTRIVYGSTFGVTYWEISKQFLLPVKDSLKGDPRYKSVKHDDREKLFNEYIVELKAAEEETLRKEKAKQDEEDKLKERERVLRKRKEREEQEVERVRQKARRKEAIESYQALLVETIKDPQASWTELKPKLEKDPQGRAANPHFDKSDLEKLFREHVKTLYERCALEFRALLTDVITAEAAAQETEDGKTVVTSWSTAKQLLKSDPRYNKMPRKERESLWRRHTEEILRKQKKANDPKPAAEGKVSRIYVDSGKHLPVGSRRTHDRR
ncbi:pre-mRNA-processing protein 40c [Phtheirospermum japonicum]|uniref:Pre-mRNA-processing protein 40c n=1 Tax=Phtheirospermum japonicum TaxID=374723 RepID=A0A830D3G7_9LAMI|nr:pre-mRNA-processing protein 40c [Phtheirospermum japonicum]